MSQPPQGQNPYGPPSGGGQPPYGQPPSGEQPTTVFGQQPGQFGGWGNQQGQQPTEQFGQQGPGPYGPGQQGFGQQGQGQQGPPPTQQFPQPGGGYGGPPYGGPGGPNGPGGPGGPGGPFGGPPPESGGSKNGLIIAGVAALVIIIAVGVTLFLTFGGEDEDIAGPTSETTTTAESTSESSSSSSRSSSSSSSSTASSSPSGSDDLLAILPPDFTDCVEGDIPSDGAVAAADCGPATSQPGPEAAGFFLYEDQATLGEVFASDIGSLGVQPIAEGQDCMTAIGSGTWTAGGVPGGQVACGISDQGYVFLVWTDDEFLTEGFVQLTGSSQTEVAALYTWWLTNSAYAG